MWQINTVKLLSQYIVTYLVKISSKQTFYLSYLKRIFDSEQRKEINLLVTYDFSSAKFITKG